MSEIINKRTLSPTYFLHNLELELDLVKHSVETLTKNCISTPRVQIAIRMCMIKIVMHRREQPRHGDGQSTVAAPTRMP
jgi:hypothetical protein